MSFPPEPKEGEFVYGHGVTHAGKDYLPRQSHKGDQGMTEPLIKILQWAKEYIDDGTAFDENDEPITPNHHCDYIHNPEAGHCDFCQMYSELCEMIVEMMPIPKTGSAEFHQHVKEAPCFACGGYHGNLPCPKLNAT